MYDLAYVSATVTSQVTHLPLCHGIKETPSGLLPLLSRHSGSLIDCIFALVIVRHAMSFKMLCRVCLPEFFKREKQCSPRASIVCPHWQKWGRHIVAPRHRATAIRMASLSRKRPQQTTVARVTNRQSVDRMLPAAVHGPSQSCSQIVSLSWPCMQWRSDDFRAPPQTNCLGPWPRGYGDYFFLAGPWRAPGGPLAGPWRAPGGPLAGPWRAPGGPLAGPFSPAGPPAVAGPAGPSLRHCMHVHLHFIPCTLLVCTASSNGLSGCHCRPKRQIVK